MKGWGMHGNVAGELWPRLFWSPRAVAVWASEPRQGGVVGVLSATAALTPFWPILFKLVDEPFGNSAGGLTLGLLTLSGYSAALIVPLAVLLARAGRVTRVFLLAWTPVLLPLGCSYGWAIYYLLRYYPSFIEPVRWRPRGVEAWIDATVGSCGWLVACGFGWALIAAWALALIRTIPARPGPAHACAACGYDLRGSVSAGSIACPECGEWNEAPAAPLFMPPGRHGVRRSGEGSRG